MRREGRLVMIVWQADDRNEWNVAIRQALTGPGAAVSAGPDPFSLADPPVVTGILEGAGFMDVTFADVHKPMYFGSDVAIALDWIRGFAYTSEVLNRLNPAAVASALGRLRETLAAHLSGGGIWFDSRAWIVTAHRRLRGHGTGGRCWAGRDYSPGTGTGTCDGLGPRGAAQQSVGAVAFSGRAAFRRCCTASSSRRGAGDHLRSSRGWPDFPRRGSAPGPAVWAVGATAPGYRPTFRRKRPGHRRTRWRR
jgi:hypothetical protein